MTIRCRIRPVELWLWRYEPKANIPLWVVKRFHKLGDAPILQTASGSMVRPGEYCGLVEPHGAQQATMFTVEEYTVMFATKQLELAPDEMPEGYDL